MEKYVLAGLLVNLYLYTAALSFSIPSRTREHPQAGQINVCIFFPPRMMNFFIQYLHDLWILTVFLYCFSVFKAFNRSIE
ncbi:hypothetical protein bcere0009_54870 [Bacillus cereus R309803]|nr:hypothetical protein bcere0009_54870 [Bacillus cereus R309803]